MVTSDSVTETMNAAKTVAITSTFRVINIAYYHQYDRGQGRTEDNKM